MFLLGDYRAAIEEHRKELALSEILHDVIGSAVANRKIGECYAELGNIEAALKVCLYILVRRGVCALSAVIHTLSISLSTRGFI